MNNIISQEKKWLNNQDKKKIFVLQLKKLGWNVSFEDWTEFVHLKVDSSIIKRWLNPGNDYRKIILKHYKEETLIRLEKLFKKLDGHTIKQKLLHTKIFAINNN